MKEQKEKCKIMVIAILLGICCVLTYYFHNAGQGTVFTHFFYVPIILAAIWWRRKGIGVAIFLALLLLFSHFFIREGVETVNDLIRAPMFLIVAFVAAILSERIARVQEEVKKDKNIIANVPDSLLVLDKDWRVKKANLSFQKIFGIEPEKAVGTRLLDIVGDEAGKLSIGLTRVFGTKTAIHNLELRYHSEKLGDRIFNIAASGIIVASEEGEGEEEEVLVVIEDITMRKRAEEELRKLNKELELRIGERTKELKKERDYTRHLMESSPDFQLTLDKGGKIMDVNEAFVEIVDKSRGDLIGESIYEYLPKKETEKAILEILEKKRVKNIELTADIPGKGALLLNFAGTVFTTPEGEVGIYATGRDITELREKETQLIHAGRLSSLGQMATGIAHEINQPLTVISMAAEGTLRDIEKKRVDVSALPKDLEDIMSNVKRIDRIITHMRTFAREPGEIRAVKPEEVLNNAFILLGEQFKMHAILVSRETEANLPLIEVDANQLEQVFVNILTNARQVLDEREEEAKRKGEIFEKRLVCRISRERENENEHEWVVYEFADNTYGVPEELKMKVFEPFFTTKEPGEGTGLGLSIAYGIVTRLGGKIWVEDNEMGGASFKVAVPVGERGQKSEKRGQRIEKREQKVEVVGRGRWGE
ncbi:MAG: PAS domain-containing protein [Halobacteriota archaeon]